MIVKYERATSQYVKRGNFNDDSAKINFLK